MFIGVDHPFTGLAKDCMQAVMRLLSSKQGGETFEWNIISSLWECDLEEQNRALFDPDLLSMSLSDTYNVLFVELYAIRQRHLVLNCCVRSDDEYEILASPLVCQTRQLPELFEELIALIWRRVSRSSAS